MFYLSNLACHLREMVRGVGLMGFGALAEPVWHLDLGGFEGVRMGDVRWF